jgi:RNA polymerase sigma-70 factor (ECF subfamily)
MDQETQDRLAAGIRQGDRETWERFYDTFAERLWRAASRRIGHDAAGIADVVQETFLAAAQSARRFDPSRGSLWAWLFGIARNQIALYFRRQAPRLKFERALKWWHSMNGRVEGWLDGSSASSIESIECEEMATLIRKTLTELPPEYESLLTDRYLEGRSVDEIASEMRRSSTAVRSRLARARRRFRKTFVRLAKHNE